MRTLPFTVAVLTALISLAGCTGSGGDPADQEARTVRLTLEVGASSSSTVPLYTLNDGERTMNVVAVPFQVPGQDQPEVPSPQIRLREGDTLILTVINNNPLPHTFHLHGGLVDWDMDGVPFLNQMPILQGEEREYVFKDLKAGTYFYHCHVDVAHHMDLGMAGAFIVEEKDPPVPFDREYVLLLDEWDNCHVHGNLDPVQNAENNAAVFEREECLQRVINDQVVQNRQLQPITDQICALDPPQEVKDALNCGAGRAPPGTDARTWYPVTFPVYTPEYNTFTINGKAFPDTQPIAVEEGETVRLRFINIGDEMHSMHLHGHTMLVTHRDGYPLDSPFKVDTLGIMPGERYDVIVKADNPGFWAFHDHVGLNVMNDHISPGGMFTCFAYDGFLGQDILDSQGHLTPDWQRSIQCFDTAMEHFDPTGKKAAQARHDVDAFYAQETLDITHADVYGH